MKVEHAFLGIGVARYKKESLFVLNVDSNPSETQRRFKTLQHKTIMVAGNAKLLVCVDFNTMDQSWGNVTSNAKGRNLAQNALEIVYVLVTETANHTRIENSASSDTTPELTLPRTLKPTKSPRKTFIQGWSPQKESLLPLSPHSPVCILRVRFPHCIDSSSRRI
ncbi:hypothetical protein HPB48_026696 [Haemaphysalis longicornis]|uniref:Uncharacterized protein n=1 Tax=Haemaphysalis longicornis TaxID=44386 RepID=A0A9J6HCZ2_HAELO|nr:hypothetical protein HPB48_026696 [Haemaphysalis longicornis]